MIKLIFMGYQLIHLKIEFKTSVKFLISNQIWNLRIKMFKKWEFYLKYL
jgi:hypothetical protein